MMQKCGRPSKGKNRHPWKNCRRRRISSETCGMIDCSRLARAFDEAGYREKLELLSLDKFVDDK